MLPAPRTCLSSNRALPAKCGSGCVTDAPRGVDTLPLWRTGCHPRASKVGEVAYLPPDGRIDRNDVVWRISVGKPWGVQGACRSRGARQELQARAPAATNPRAARREPVA